MYKRILLLVTMIGPALWLTLASARGQLAWGDVEAMARNYFQAEAEGAGWLEGFAEKVAGDSLTYPSHRDPQSPAMLVRATDGKYAMEWLTAPVPADWKGQSATFVWVAGLGTGSGNRRFDVFVNDEPRFSFMTPLKWEWSAPGQGGGELRFFAAELNKDGDLMGYLRLTAPAEWLTPGKPLRLKIAGEAAQSSTWVVTFGFTDSVAHLRRDEIKPVYHDLSLRHEGRPTLRVVARPEWKGKAAAIRDGKGEVGRAALQDWGEVSGVYVALPRPSERVLGSTLDILVDGRPLESLAAPNLGMLCLKAFLAEELRAERYVFPVGPFPPVDWARPGMVSSEMGPFRLEVAYYDAEMNRVETAAKPGRYGAAVTAKTPDGYTMRRYITLFCTSAEWSSWRDRIEMNPKPFEPIGIPADVWQAWQDDVNRFFSSLALDRIKGSPEAAVFLAALSAAKTRGDLLDYQRDPWNQDRQWWVILKRKEAGVTGRYPDFARPLMNNETAAPVLRQGDPASVGYDKEDVESIRAFCQRWAEVGREPLTVLVARKGVIVLHEAFGTIDGRPMTLDTPTSMASITKWMTGTLMMEFVDQGLVDLDDPVKKYLPEFDRPVEQDLTIRHLFTFTGGFIGHGGWGGDWNHAFENCVGQYLPHLEVGKRSEYSGDGYVLAGKIMERISGKAFPHLIQDHLFGPLGAGHTSVTDAAAGAHSTCLDMAKWMQMIVNQGSYGTTRFFSKDTFAKMQPIKLDRLVPGLESEFGIGCFRAFGSGFSRTTFGCGAFSGAIVRADVENQLVVVMCRNRLGARYGEFEGPFQETCTAPLAKK